MNGISIRPFRGESLSEDFKKQMVALFRQLDNEEIADYSKFGLKMSDADDQYLGDMISLDSGFIAVNEANRVIGMVSNVNMKECENATYLSKLVVDPLYRRNGIGRMLMEHAIQENYKNGNETVLNVSVSNGAAISLYKSLGFVLHSQTMVTTHTKDSEGKLMTDEKKNEVLDEDLRLAYYYLSIHRRMLDNMRIGYLKRFKDSGKLFTNEKAKAERCQCDINTIDGWLERFHEFAVKENEVSHLNEDYSHKKILSFKKEDKEAK